MDGRGRWRRPSPLALLCGGLLSLFVMTIVALVVADISYLGAKGVSWGLALDPLKHKEVVFALRMSVATSLTTLALVMLTAVPIGYALARFRFPGRSLVNTVVDVPIVLPPVVVGISLLALFSYGVANPVKHALAAMQLSLASGLGIVMCQYLVAVSYCIRSAKTAFQGVDQSLEQVARVLGCSEWRTFWRVSLPLARHGLIAGGVMAWARAIGVFGPLMVVVGTGPRVLVMPTTMWLELSTGNIEVAVVIALMMLLLAGAALTIVHWLSPEGVAL
jgi:molybdate transport system permease protein